MNLAGEEFRRAFPDAIGPKNSFTVESDAANSWCATCARRSTSCWARWAACC